MLEHVKLLILDIDGVIYCGNDAIPGAQNALEELQKRGFIVKFLTNDGVNSRHSRAKALNSLGFNIEPANIYTAASLAAEYLRRMGSPRTMFLFEGDSLQEFFNIPVDEDQPEFVLVGDFFHCYDFERLDRAFRAIMDGAGLLAVQRNRYWAAGPRPIIDIGLWVAGIEYCTGVSAKIIGKPEIGCYKFVCSESNVEPQDAIMVSDDLYSDLKGAYEAGLRIIHVTDCSVNLPMPAPVIPDLTIPNLSALSSFLA